MAASTNHDASVLRQRIAQARRQNDAAQDRIADARARIRECEDQLAQLLRERAELQDFRAASSRDISELQSQAEERRAAVSALGSTQNVTAFTTFLSAVGQAIDWRTRRDIDAVGSDVARQIDRADDDIQREVDALKARIASLEQAIWDDRRLIAANDDSIARLSAELRAAH